MNIPSLPTGYNVAKHVLVGRSDCHVTVGFDRERAHIPWFLVQLQYQVQETADPRRVEDDRPDGSQPDLGGRP